MSIRVIILKKEVPENNCFRMTNCSTFASLGTVWKSARILQPVKFDTE